MFIYFSRFSVIILLSICSPYFIMQYLPSFFGVLDRVSWKYPIVIRCDIYLCWCLCESVCFIFCCSWYLNIIYSYFCPSALICFVLFSLVCWWCFPLLFLYLIQWIYYFHRFFFFSFCISDYSVSLLNCLLSAFSYTHCCLSF